MKIFDLLKISFKALQKSKIRTFLTMLGVIIGVAAVITMMAIGQGSKESIHTSLSGMGSNMINIMPVMNEPGSVRLQGSSMQTLKQEDADAIVNLNSPDIKGVSPIVSASGQAINGPNNWPTTVIGVSPDYLGIRQFKIKDGILNWRIPR